MSSALSALVGAGFVTVLCQLLPRLSPALYTGPALQVRKGVWLVSFRWGVWT